MPMCMRMEDIEEPTMEETHYLDKLVDEQAEGIAEVWYVTFSKQGDRHQ